MTDLPAGPELDRAVAIAMGYRTSGRRQKWSTNPRHIDELLAWLDQRCEWVEITQYRGRGPRSVVALALINADHDADPQGVGATIPEALARLVVAVKEASDG